MVRQPLVPADRHPETHPAHMEVSSETAPVRLHEIWWILQHRRWLILGCVVCTVTAAILLFARATPVYEGVTTVRMENKEPNLPQVTLTPTAGEDKIVTELNELQSRSLAEEAARALALQVAIREPRGVALPRLLSEVAVHGAAAPAVYLLQRRADGAFAVRDSARGTALGTVTPGQRAEFGGLRFQLGPDAARYPRIRLEVRPLEDVARAVQASTTVTRADGESDILTIRYQTIDRDLAWRVPNAIASAFVTRRHGLQKSDTRGLIAFLHEQLDTVSGQLTGAESKLQQFRQREGVVSPETEASTQINRLVQLQATRGTLEAERQALTKAMDEIQAAGTVERRPNASSPYRRLMAFPTLLKNRPSDDLLRTLTDLENKRTDLLSRRTERDPDVQALNERMHQVEEQLRGTANSYLHGLTDEIAADDSMLHGFGRELSALPEKQLQYARLDRQRKVLEDVSTLLQTRLKEAQIAEAAQHASMRVVDSAVAPTSPVRPRRVMYLVPALAAGLLLGIGAALSRELLDTSVRTRADVQLLTGLPVVGLIPRIPRKGARAMALIGELAATPGGGRRRRSAGLFQVKAQPGSSRHREHPILAVLPLRRHRRDAGPTEGGQGEAANGATRRFVIAANAILEAYGVLQTNIAHGRQGAGIHAVAFTSPLPGEGKTTSVINLALTLARRGLHVLLIDADLHRGMVHQVFELPRQEGLADILQGSKTVEAVRHAIEVSPGATLHVVTTGASTATAWGLLDSDAMRHLLDHCRQLHDVVIIDAPPVNVVADAVLVSRQVDGVVLVARAGVTEAAALAYAIDQLRHVDAPVLGVMLNDIDFRKNAVYDPAYRYCDYGKYAAAE